MYGRRQLALWRLADQKMNVFGHHHVADDHPLVTLPNLFQHFHEQVAARGTGQPGLPPVTTKCEEVQIVSAVPALQAPRHNRRLKEPLSSRCDLGHIVKVTDHEKSPGLENRETWGTRRFRTMLRACRATPPFTFFLRAVREQNGRLALS